MLAIGIVHEDSLVWHMGLSNENITTQPPPTRESNFMLASISKVITATAVMQLVERNELDIKADINNYLPFAVTHPNHRDLPITTEALLTHTSGLAWPTNSEDPGFNDRSPFDSAPELQSWLQNYIVPSGASFQPVTWKPSPPGDQYQYSNIGVALLGMLVQSISKTSFSEYCNKNIFHPLQMLNSGFRWSDIDHTTAVPLFYQNQEIEPYSVPHYPASTFRSTIQDFSKFMIAIIKGQAASQPLLSKSSIQEMLTVRRPSERVSYLWQHMGDDWVGHTGGYWGVTSSFAIEPNKKLGIVMVTNINGKETLYPNGRIFELIRQRALSYQP